MITLRLALRMLRRDARSGEINVLVAALVLAVASMGTVSFFADRVRGGLVRQANVLLGGDLMISADRPLPDTFAAEASARGLTSVPVIKFNSMVQRAGATGEAVLADVKAVSEGYPLRSAIMLADTSVPDGVAAAGIPRAGEAWPDERLAQRLALSIGESLAVGDSTLRVAAIVRHDPEAAGVLFTLGPRLLVNLADVAAMNLLQPGNRANFRLLVADRANRGTLTAFGDWLRHSLTAGQRQESIRDLRPEVRQTLERGEKYLGLSALVAVMLAAVAIALAASRYLRRHLDTSAMLRCFGASRRRTLALFATQFAVLGIAAGIAGIAVALVGQELLVRVLGTLSRVDLPPPGFAPGIISACAGFLLLAGFALPPLLALSNVAPLRVLRRDLPFPGASGIVAYLLGIAAVASLIVWRAQDWTTGAIMVGGMGGLIGGAAVVAWLAIVLLRRLPQRGVSWRFGLANLRRRPLASSLQIGALAVGVMALLLLTIVRDDLLRNWQESLPPDAPDHFLINILPDQIEGVRTLTKEATGSDLPLYPMVRGRLVAVNGAALDLASFDDLRARRLAEREFNISFLRELPKGNRVVAGRWFGDASGLAAGISMEEGIAQSLRLKLGDVLSYDIAGVQVNAPITSLRKVDWDSFRPNFFAIFAPGALDAMPQTWLGAVRAGDPLRSAAWQNALVQRFPNVLAIDVGDILRQVHTIIDQVARAVEFVFLFTLLGGLVVLQAAIAATQDERQYDAAVLRVLGASRRQLYAAQIAEFLLLGSLAGLLAALGATAVGYVLSKQVFQIPFTLNLLVVLYGIGGGAVCVTLAGWLGTRKIVRQSPLAAIRELG